MFRTHSVEPASVLWNADPEVVRKRNAPSRTMGFVAHATHTTIQVCAGTTALESGVARAHDLHQRPHRHGQFEYLGSLQGRAALSCQTFSGELLPRGIRVNAVSPAPIATPLLSKLGVAREPLDEINKSLESQVPLHGMGDPAEVARALCSSRRTSRRSRWGASW